MTNITIRRAKTSDIPTILLLMDQLGYPTSENTLRIRFQKFTENRGYGVAVACLEDEVVGWIAWSKSELFILDKTRFFIEGLVVDEHKRGLGIGKQLMQFVENIAHEFSPSVVDLTSGIRRAKDGSHEFYKNLGYQQDGPRMKLFFRKEL